MLPRRPSNTIATGFCVHPLTTSKWTAPRTCGSLSYARQIGLNAADKVLFIADGCALDLATQSSDLILTALGLSPTQVLGLIDFGSCREATLGRGQAAPLERDATCTRWLNRTSGAAQSEHGWTSFDHGPAGAVPRAARPARSARTSTTS